MKNIVKNVVKSIIFVIVFFIILQLITCFLVPNKNLFQFGLKSVANYEILSEDVNSIDVAFLGDSLIYSAISPMEIWHEYGYTCYDLASASQLVSKSYANLEIASKSQQLKVAFLEADVLFRNQKNKPLISEIKEEIIENIPIINHHNKWKEKLLPFMQNNNTKVSTEIYKGFKYIPKIKSGKVSDYMKKTNKKQEIPKANIEYFEKMVELCKENNIKFVLISIPDLSQWNYAKNELIIEVAKKYDIEYIDLNTNNPLNIDWKKDTRDKGKHLNYNGAIKASHYFGEYLQKSNLVTDHRNEEAYDSWNKNYEIYTSLK